MPAANSRAAGSRRSFHHAQQARHLCLGADKGGVGKTTVTRAFLDFLDAHGVSNRAFDTENEVAEGVRKRFFPERTEIVNLRDSDDQMKVFDTISGATATVIDVRAGLLSPTLQLLGGYRLPRS